MVGVHRRSAEPRFIESRVSTTRSTRSVSPPRVGWETDTLRVGVRAEILDVPRPALLRVQGGQLLGPPVDSVGAGHQRRRQNQTQMTNATSAGRLNATSAGRCGYQRAEVAGQRNAGCDPLSPSPCQPPPPRPRPQAVPCFPWLSWHPLLPVTVPSAATTRPLPQNFIVETGSIASAVSDPPFDKTLGRRVRGD
jgi:hypothetical protein